MSNKIALLLFTTSVLLTSFAVVAIPQVSALNENLNVYYNPSPMERSHVTDRFNSAEKICGDRLCAHGERTAWEKAVWDHQNKSQGKITSSKQHGEDVMHKMAGSTPSPQTGHGSEKPTVHTTMPVINATKSTGMTGNMTGNMSKTMK